MEIPLPFEGTISYHAGSANMMSQNDSCCAARPNHRDYVLASGDITADGSRFPHVRSKGGDLNC